jgi:hypothetical protein
MTCLTGNMELPRDFDTEKCPLCGRQFWSDEARVEDWTIFRVFLGSREGVRVHWLCSAKERADAYKRRTSG